MTTQKGTRYRAVCEDCNYKGPWRNSFDEALADANQHMIEHDDHITYVELRAFVH